MLDCYLNKRSSSISLAISDRCECNKYIFRSVKGRSNQLKNAILKAFLSIYLSKTTVEKLALGGFSQLIWKNVGYAGEELAGE